MTIFTPAAVRPPLADITMSRRALLAAAAAGSAALALASSMRTASGQSDEFVVANELEPSDLLPYFSSYGAVLVTRQVYQPLAEPRLTLNEQGVVDVAYTPVLAESWERVEPTRWRFALRQGVTFHNGEAWNADAAKASFDALSDGDVAAEFGRSSFLAPITGLEIVDEFTIDMVSAQPDPELLGLTLRIGFVGLPPAFVASDGIAGLAETPIGTGPYQLDRWDRGQEILLTKFADYWDADGPAMPSVRFVSRPEASVRAQTVAAGESHFAYNVGAEQAATLDNSVIGGGFQSSGIRLNNQIAPTNDVNVRRALNLAIDREGIAAAIFGGAAVPIGFFGFQPVDVAPFPYDPEQATTLIEEAGIAGMELDLVYGEARIPEEDQLAELYKASFDAIGLNITLSKMEPLQYNEVGARPFPDQPPLYMETTSNGNFGEIVGGLLDKYGCDGTGTFCSPEYDAEFAALRNLEGDARLESLQSIADRLQNDETSRVWVVAVQQVHGLAEGVVTDLPANAYIRLDDISLA